MDLALAPGLALCGKKVCFETVIKGILCGNFNSGRVGSEGHGDGSAHGASAAAGFDIRRKPMILDKSLPQCLR